MKLNRKTILLIVLFAVFIQLIIISYNMFTGYIQVESITNFLIRLFIGTAFTSVFGLLIIFMDLQIINTLDRIFPLPKRLTGRFPSEFILIIVSGIFVGSIVTLISNALMPYDDGLKKNLINNSLITIIINVIIVLGIEAFIWFRRNQQSLVKTEVLQKENALNKFETLKNQLNPHFLFNSLNVLSSLIKRDTLKAQEFVDEFSSVYRYTLDVIEKPVIELKEELEFARSYLYLQRIRFEDAVLTEINVNASMLNKYVPPLALQTILENAFKHNKASAGKPLKLRIYNEGNVLIVTNNLQPKINLSDSKGVGLNNLKKRYEYLGNKEPQFLISENDYTAKIPLLEIEG